MRGDWQSPIETIRASPIATASLTETRGRPGNPTASVLRYDTITPHVGHEGALDEMAMYAGEGVGRVHDLPTAATLLETLWREVGND